MSPSAKNYVKVFVAVILLGVIIFFGRTKIVGKTREGVIYTLRPFMAVGRNLGEKFGYGVENNRGIDNLAENQEFKALLFESEKLREENEILKRALNIKESAGVKLRGANIIMFGKEFGKEFFIIDQGGESGVAKGNLVIDSNRFLIGRIESVEDGSSKVTVASNAGEIYEATLLPSGDKVLARGVGARSFSIELVPEDASVRPGDFVFFKEGGVQLLLAEIAAVRPSGGSIFKEIKSTLLSRPERLGEVFIITK